MTNFPPEYCPYCGGGLDPVDPPTAQHCKACDEYVYHNPCPGGGTVVVDGDRLLLIEDFRPEGGWKPPEGRVECGESPREGVARELEEETNLTVDPADLVYLYDRAAEPVEGQYMVGIYYAVDRADTTGPLAAGDDAVDTRFFSPAEFAASDCELREKYDTPFWYPDLERLHGIAAAALDARGRNGND